MLRLNQGGLVKLIDHSLLDDLSAAAAASVRGRRNYNLHPVLEDPVQRLLNAMEPGTYIRPHRHGEPGKWELFVVLRGVAVALVFDGDGHLVDRVELRAGGPNHAIEIAPGAWHSIVVLEPRTVLLEVKPGPYSPLGDKDFAAWAPTEADAAAPGFETWLRTAGIGDLAPPF